VLQCKAGDLAVAGLREEDVARWVSRHDRRARAARRCLRELVGIRIRSSRRRVRSGGAALAAGAGAGLGVTALLDASR
jgi:hypothetical protein